MKKIALALMLFALASCDKTNDDNSVVSQKFVHKYGFEISQKEWQNRNSEGQILSTLQDGRVLSQSFTEGKLQGITTYTYPDSLIVEKALYYDEGTLQKIVLHDNGGIPFYEEVYDYDNQKTITIWNEKGVPIRKEEYRKSLLQFGEYFNPQNELESKIDEGNGFRICRDRKGTVVSKDLFQDGKLLTRTTFFENGNIQGETSYNNYSLHGEQKKYAINGNLVLQQNFKNGELDGVKLSFRNNQKILEIPFNNGKKHGIEKHYDNEGSLTAEIHWENNKRHGSQREFSDENTHITWFFRGKKVSPDRFELMEFEERLMADLKDNNINYPFEVLDLTTDEDSNF